MNFNIISIFPDFFDSFLTTGVIGKALTKGLAKVNITTPREFTKDKHQSVDSPPYGGGDGMLMQYAPLKGALTDLKQKGTLGKVYNLSPQGKKWDYKMAEVWAKNSSEAKTIICGRYAGIDQRFIENFVDEEISLGDYILSGAELAACVLIDSTLRFVPGVLGHPDSSIKESFTGQLLEAPQFTQPQIIDELEVPSVLLSGHHKKIEDWKYLVAVVKTKILRPDLLIGSSVEVSQVQKAMRFVSLFSDSELRAIGVTRSELEDIK